MRLFVSLTILILSALYAIASSGEPIRSNVISRVVRVEFADVHDGKPTIHFGAAFTLEVGDRQYLITAAHIVHRLKSEIVLNIISPRRGHSRISGIPIFSSNPEVDILALELKDDLTVRSVLPPTMDGIALGQQIYFLGYPFGLESRDPGGSAAPFVKSGIISAVDSSHPTKHVIYLDAHNNSGFSGGPIVFWHEPTSRFRIAGVVSGYRPDEQPVYQDVRQPDGSISRVALPGVLSRENPGILIGFEIEHIIEAIEANRITRSH